jgi:hypothetical protein
VDLSNDQATAATAAITKDTSTATLLDKRNVLCYVTSRGVIGFSVSPAAQFKQKKHISTESPGITFRCRQCFSWTKFSV